MQSVVDLEASRIVGELEAAGITVVQEKCDIFVNRD